MRDVSNSLFDFTKPTKCEQAVGIDGGGKPGLDHCFCLEGTGLKHAGRYVIMWLSWYSLIDEEAGRTLEVWTTEPGMQVYMGNWIEGEYPHVAHTAVALECQHYPDSPNKPTFPSTVLNPEDTYKQTTIFKIKNN